MEMDFRTMEKIEKVRSVSRALALLSALGKKGKTLTELSMAVGISPSTASRLLNTLEAEGFVSCSQDNKYGPGLMLTSLLYKTDQWAPLRMIARNATQALGAEFGETAAFFVRRLSERLCIESVESTQLVRRVCHPGERGKIFMGAAGKTLLAFDKEDEAWDELFDFRDSFTTATGEVRTVADLKAECERIRKQGYAFSQQESTLESWAVAAPLHLDRTLVGALTMVIPSTRYSEEYLDRVIRKTIEIATAYSNKQDTESDHAIA